MPDPRSNDEQTTAPEPLRRAVGRPPELSQEVQDRIVLLLRQGNYIETAAAFAGVDKHSLYAWMKRGVRATRKARRQLERGEGDGSIPEADQPFVSFMAAVDSALGFGEIRDLVQIDRASQGQLEIDEVTESTEPLVLNGVIVTREDGSPVLITRTTRRRGRKLPDWRAAAWRLERREPERWGRMRHELTGADGKDLIPMEAVREVLRNAEQRGEGDVSDEEFDELYGDDEED